MREDVRPFLAPPESVPFFAELIGISYCDGTYYQHRENTPLCVVEYIVEGTGTLIVDGRTYTASAGDVYILAPGTVHTYYSDSEQPWTKLFINALGAVVPPLLDAYGLREQVVFPQCPLEPLFRELFALADTGLPQDTIMERCALKFHEILIGVAANARPQSVVPEEALRLKALIDAQLHRVVSIDELAASLYRSGDYVIKLFKRWFGTTPHAYATRRKVMTAQKLLAETRIPVGEIAASLGYEDPQYFSHVFRRETGLSPTACRKTPRV